MTQYVGLDVSLEETSVCVLDAAGSICWEGKVSSEPEAIARMLQIRAPQALKVGLETGPTSTWLWHELRAAGVGAVCIDARHAEAALSMRLNKTDRNDAAGIAQLMRMGWYREVQVKQLAAHGDGALLASRALLVRQRCELESQIRGLMKNFGLRPKATKGKAFEQSVRALAARHAVLKDVVAPLLAAWSALVQQIGVLTYAVQKRTKNSAGLGMDFARRQTLRAKRAVPAGTVATVRSRLGLPLGSASSSVTASLTLIRRLPQANAMM